MFTRETLSSPLFYARYNKMVDDAHNTTQIVKLLIWPTDAYAAQMQNNPCKNESVFKTRMLSYQ